MRSMFHDIISVFQCSWGHRSLQLPRKQGKGMIYVRLLVRRLSDEFLPFTLQNILVSVKQI